MSRFEIKDSLIYCQKGARCFTDWSIRTFDPKRVTQIPLNEQRRCQKCLWVQKWINILKMIGHVMIDLLEFYIHTYIYIPYTFPIFVFSFFPSCCLPSCSSNLIILLFVETNSAKISPVYFTSRDSLLQLWHHKFIWKEVPARIRKKIDRETFQCKNDRQDRHKDR